MRQFRNELQQLHWASGSSWLVRECEFAGVAPAERSTLGRCVNEEREVSSIGAP